MSRIIAQKERLKLGTFLSRPPQNNNVNSPKFACSENVNSDGELCKFPFGTQICLQRDAKVEVWRRKR